MIYYFDSSFLIALFHKKDSFHQKSVGIIEQLNRLGAGYMTSNIALAETINYLFRRLGKTAAKKFLEGFRESQIEEFFVSQEIFTQGYNLLFRQKSKRALNLFDCLHLATMETLGLKTILSFDAAFKKELKVIP